MNKNGFGLKGVDAIVYGLLADNSQLSASQIACHVNYTYNSVLAALRRLDEECQLISRQRERRGQRYKFDVLEKL
jgi:predicted transcriptional regulator